MAAPITKLMKDSNQEEAINSVMAACVEECLDKITIEETFQIFQELQTSQLNLDDHEPLLSQVNFLKFGQGKKQEKRTQLLKIIKNVEDMIKNQQQQQGQQGGGDESYDQAGSQPAMINLRSNEQMVLACFALVLLFLLYISCCTGNTNEKKVKQKKQSSTKKQSEERVEEQEEEEEEEKECKFKDD